MDLRQIDFNVHIYLVFAICFFVYLNKMIDFISVNSYIDKFDFWMSLKEN